jgi:choline-glycine betaine transporter
MFEKQILSAIIIASALLMLSSIVLLIPISSAADFLPEHLKEMQMHDSAPQRLAHAVWVLLIALTCAFILIRPRRH